MPHSLNLVLDQPPKGFYTCEDVVSGKVILEGSHLWSIGCVMVSFYGVIDTVAEIQGQQSQPQGGDASTRSVDKEVLFQLEKRLDQADGKGEHRINREWPFQFGLEGSWGQDLTLPSSGKYHQSKVEYKVVAVLGKEGEDEDKVRMKISPRKKPSEFHETDFGFWARKQMGHVVERNIDLIESRSNSFVDDYIPLPYYWNLEISAKHLPSFPLEREHKGIFHHHQKIDMVSFDVKFEIAQTVVQGAPYLFNLSVSSEHLLWLQLPPPIILTEMKMDLRVITIERAVNSRAESVHDITIFHHRDLCIPLSSQPLDLGKILSLLLSGQGVTSTFSTRLLERRYKLKTEVTLTVGDKTSNLKACNQHDIVLLPSLVVAARPQYIPPHPYPSEPSEASARTRKEIHLHYHRLARISQVGSDPLRPSSILEAALTLSRLLTARRIMHSFPGAATIKLHAYKPPGNLINDTDFDPWTDEQKILLVFRDEMNCPFRYAPKDDFAYNEEDLTFRYEEKPGGGKDVIYDLRLVFLPRSKTPLNALQQKMYEHDWIKTTKGRADEVQLGPIPLFNWRLECAVTKDGLSEDEMWDFESLESAFGSELREGVKKRKINVNMARVAVGRYEQLRGVLAKIGIVGGGEDGRRAEVEPSRTGEEENPPEYEWVKGEKGWEDEKQRCDEKQREGGKQQGGAKQREEEWRREDQRRREDEWRREDQRRREDDWRAGNRNWKWDEVEKERIKALKRDFLNRKHAKEDGEKGTWDAAPPPWEQENMNSTHHQDGELSEKKPRPKWKEDFSEY